MQVLKKNLKKMYFILERNRVFLNQWETHHQSLHLIFSSPVEESDPDSLISNENQSLMTASDGMKELDGFSFGIKAPEELQPKGFESICNPIPALMCMGCCILDEKHLDCFVESHPPDSPKR